MIKSKREAYLYLIYWLARHRDSIPPEIFDHLTDQLQIAFENHGQDYKTVFFNVLHIAKEEKLDSELSTILDHLSQIDYSQSTTPQEQFENEVGRHFESCISIELFQNPTDQMMASIKRISDALIIKLEQWEKVDPFSEDDFLFSLTQKKIALSCGAPIDQPLLEDVIQILKKNDPNDFPEIMHIHYKFAVYPMRDLPIVDGPSHAREPIGKMSKIIKQYFSEEKDEDEKQYLTRYREALSKINDLGYETRALVSNKRCYDAPLYRAERNRGRLGDIRREYTNQLGVMLPTQDDKYYPVYKKDQRWIADARSQAADFNSSYVLDLIENDGVYVSGPSGMTSLLMGLMELYGNFESLSLKQNYLSAIMAYIVGAGFHSIHEVIGPAQYALRLVPGYHISVPKKFRLAEPPNFQLFFAQQESIDPQFSERRINAWNKLLGIYAIRFGDYYEEIFKTPLEKSQNAILQACEEYLAINVTAHFGKFRSNSRDERELVIKLKEHCFHAEDMSDIATLLHNFFEKITNTDNYSFIGFLCQAFKSRPDSMNDLNQFSTLKLQLDPTFNYTIGRESNAARREALDFMTNIQPYTPPESLTPF